MNFDHTCSVVGHPQHIGSAFAVQDELQYSEIDKSVAVDTVVVVAVAAAVDIVVAVKAAFVVVVVDAADKLADVVGRVVAELHHRSIEQSDVFDEHHVG